MKHARLFVKTACCAFAFRQIVACLFGPDSHQLPVGILLIFSFSSALFSPAGATIATLFAVPLLNGLDQAAILTNSLTTVICGTYLGHIVHQLKVPGAIHTVVKQRNRKIDLVYLFNIFVIIATCREIARHYYDENFVTTIFCGSAIGFGDKYFFLNAGILWIQGLMLLELLQTLKSKLLPLLVSTFKAYLAIITILFLFQRLTGAPQLYSGFIAFLPFEDISSFGSIAVTIYAFFLSLSLCTRLPAFTYIAAALVFFLVVASWSRGAWLTCALVTMLLIWRHLPIKYLVSSVTAIVALVAVVNIYSESSFWQTRPYLLRLIALAKIEPINKKDQSRIDLYRKAALMIREHPIAGHGIGSFYLVSVNYARDADPYGKIPDFAHNIFAQIAAELGIPAAAVLLIIIILAILNPIFLGLNDPHWSIRIACSAALTAYVFTQLTANSLNVYLSNQLIFWLLVYSLLDTNHPARLKSGYDKIPSPANV